MFRPEKRRHRGESNRNLPKPERKVIKKTKPGFSQRCPAVMRETTGVRWNKGSLDWTEEKHFHHEDSQAVEKLAQQGCAIFFLRGFHNYIGKSPE